MRTRIATTFVIFIFATTLSCAEEIQDSQVDTRAVKPLPAPSYPKINSVITKKPPLVSPVGHVLTADGLGKSYWALPTAPGSGAASSGAILQADGSGGSTWNMILGIANGGTGSLTQNFVDLTTNQTNIAGDKTFVST